MKCLTYILTVLSVFNSAGLAGQLSSINGHVQDRRENKGHTAAFVSLEGTKKITMTSVDGSFKLDSIEPGAYDLRCWAIGSGDTTFRINLIPEPAATLAITLPPYCKYEASEKNRTCPKCSKQDKVVPIYYGIAMRPLDKKHVYYAGCNLNYCNPHWYCKRDKLKF